MLEESVKLISYKTVKSDLRNSRISKKLTSPVQCLGPLGFRLLQELLERAELRLGLVDGDEGRRSWETRHGGCDSHTLTARRHG